jgi:predicted metalloprotease
MRLSGRRQSGNVQERRGMRPGRGAIGGGLGMIVLVVMALWVGVDPTQLVNLTPPTTQQQPPQAPAGEYVGTPHEEEMKEFVSVILAATEDVWHDVFQHNGDTYREPSLVLFSGGVQSACGSASTAVGPFYCPVDQDVYLDLSFFDELSQRFGAPGDFAAAYVIAHEVGHHVQNLMGIMEDLDAYREKATPEQYNRMSVRVELQADFLAGVWGYHARHSLDLLEAGDLEEALAAATAIGDDRLQKRAQGTVVPDAFTHGTSAQRVKWFRRGFETGDISAGDTFQVPYEEL